MARKRVVIDVFYECELCGDCYEELDQAKECELSHLGLGQKIRIKAQEESKLLYHETNQVIREIEAFC